MKAILVIFSVLLLSGIIGTEAFAEKSASIQKTVNVDGESLVDAMSDLGKYSQILPEYIQSSRLIDDNVANMKIGLDWITFDTEIKFVETNDGAILEVISGDFKGTTLDVTINDRTDSKTDVIAALDLQTSWYMGIMTSFVSDDDIEDMLHTSLDGLVEHIKNPQYVEPIEEEEKFCIFGLCF